MRALWQKGQKDWSRRAESNRLPADYESAALPNELRRPKSDGLVTQGFATGQVEIGALAGLSGAGMEA